MKIKQTDEYASVGRGEFYYSVYGLTFRANQLLPGLLSLSEPVEEWDVSIHLSKTWQESTMPVPLSAWQPSSKHPYLWTATFEEETYFQLRYAVEEHGYGEFVINSCGSKVWVSAYNPHLRGVDFLRAIASILVGSVMGCVLRIRGAICLHANAVIVNKLAIAIVGFKGAGKSTTTAALLQMGQDLLSDDIAVLLEGEKTFFVQPGYSGLRLHKNVARELYGTDKHLQIISTISGYKHHLPSEQIGKFPSRYPVALRAVYILEERETDLEVTSIQPIVPAAGIFTLASNTYANYMLDGAGKANQFKFLSRLAATVPLRQVHRPDNLKKLPELCEAIIEDVRCLDKKTL